MALFILIILLGVRKKIMEDKFAMAVANGTASAVGKEFKPVINTVKTSTSASADTVKKPPSLIAEKKITAEPEKPKNPYFKNPGDL